MNEEWKTVPGIDERYEVSSLGRARSWCKRGPGSQKSSEPQLLKTTISHGYYYVEVRVAGEARPKRCRLSRLVLLAFAGEPKSGYEFALHNDGDKTDNSLSNLRWGSRSENESDKDIHGTKLRGETANPAKLNESQVLEIKELLRDGQTCASIARQYHVSRNAVSLIKSGKNWSWLTLDS